MCRVSSKVIFPRWAKGKGSGFCWCVSVTFEDLLLGLGLSCSTVPLE